jgi:hypothetical protein
MPLESQDAALPCILSCVLHGPLARIDQYIVTRACDAAQLAATTRQLLHAPSAARRAHASCTCFTMPVAMCSLVKAPSPLSPRSKLRWACANTHPQSARGTPPQARLSPPSAMFATAGAFPAHTSTGTGLFSSLICARTGWAHPHPTSALRRDSFSPAPAPRLAGLTPVPPLRWDGTRSPPHLRRDWLGSPPSHLCAATGLFSSRTCASTGWAHPRPASALRWDAFSPAPAPGLGSSPAHICAETQSQRRTLDRSSPTSAPGRPQCLLPH